MLLSLFLLVLKILFWIPAEFSNKGQSSLSFKASFLKLSAVVVLRASFRYLSRTTVAKRFLSVPRFIGGRAFSACSSLASYHFKAPIYSIMLRMVASLERAWPASSMLIYIEADQVVELLAIYIEPSCSAIAVVVGSLLRLSCNVLRILKWTSISTS
jgi:hypothetical protein